LINDFKPRNLKPHDYFVKNEMSFFTFDYYQTRYMLEQKKIKDLYNKRLSLQDSLIIKNDSIIKNYKTVIELKQQQLDTTNKSLLYYVSIVNMQKQIISNNKNKIRRKNTVIISLIGAIGATFLLTL
jgi:archaellin